MNNPTTASCGVSTQEGMKPYLPSILISMIVAPVFYSIMSLFLGNFIWQGAVATSLIAPIMYTIFMILRRISNDFVQKEN